MEKRTKVIAIVSMLAVAVVIAASLAVYYNVRQQPSRGVAMDDLKALFRPEDKQLGDILVKTFREFRGNAVAWSAVYYGCLFGSAFFSAMAALILKLEMLAGRQKLRNDLAAILATAAALLVTLSTTGDFQRKWQANRIAAAAMQNLAVELARPSAAKDTEAILARYQKINDVRNRGIVGEAAEDAGKESQGSPGRNKAGAVEDADKAARP